MNYFILLYLLVSTRAVIGHFSGPFSPVRPAKLILLQNCFVIYRQLFLTFIASKNLKHFYTLNDFKLTRFAFEVRQKFEAVPRE